MSLNPDSQAHGEVLVGPAPCRSGFFTLHDRRRNADIRQELSVLDRTHYILTVSYTHLDVYKRQGLLLCRITIFINTHIILGT